MRRTLCWLAGRLAGRASPVLEG
ncbi:hypothetical protein A2U01_0116568, partial [Trifolium medium]|nr:hypothetical protein [Trifolium medium]